MFKTNNAKLYPILNSVGKFKGKYSAISLQSGYTLLELLVVLVIIGLLSGIMMPRLVTFYDSLNRAFERDEIIAQLNRLSYVAFQTRRGFTLRDYPSKDKSISLNLPEGWTLHTKQAIIYRANGACGGGVVQLSHPQQSLSLRLEAPFCQIRKEG